MDFYIRTRDRGIHTPSVPGIKYTYFSPITLNFYIREKTMTNHFQEMTDYLAAMRAEGSRERTDFFKRLRDHFESVGVNMADASDDDILALVNRMQVPSVESQKAKNDVAGDFAGFGWQSQTPPDNEAVVVERIVTKVSQDFPQFPRSGIQAMVQQVRKEHLFDPYTPNRQPSHHG